MGRKTQERHKQEAFYRHTVAPVAARIAASIIDDARASTEPVVFVTGNRYFPAGRSFIEAEEIYQHRLNESSAAHPYRGGEAYEVLWEEIERLLNAANVLLDAPEYDNCLYAVDLARWQYREDGGDSETLSGEWEPITGGEGGE